MPEWGNLVKAFGPLDFLDYTLRGCGQVRARSRVAAVSLLGVMATNIHTHNARARVG
jgi:hypothetical protein